MRFRWPFLGIVVAAACQPDTTRPPFPPLPESATTEVRLPPADAARLIAEQLRADSVPANRFSLKDAWLESDWFEAATGKRAKRRPLGLDVVRVRGWADPSRPGSSKLIVETVYHPLADPSLSERELDQQVPRNHPVAIKVRAALQELVKRYGAPPPVSAQPRAAPGAEEPDVEQPPDQGPEESPALPPP
jgi:hypothetical protein